MQDKSVWVNDLTKKFGDFTAVDNISFSVDKGEIFGFLGANGAGKTTTIRMLCGLLKPTGGEGMVSGIDVLKGSEKIKRKIGYMSQKFSLYPDVSVIENLYFYGRLYNLPDELISARLEKLNQKLPFRHIEHILTGDLPLGQKQIAALLGSLVHDPPIIFLDEPTSGVDPISRRSFWRIIRELADEGKTIFVTTHFMEEAEYCDRISIMHLGKIIALNTPDILKTETGTASIQELFVKLIRSAA